MSCQTHVYYLAAGDRVVGDPSLVPRGIDLKKLYRDKHYELGGDPNGGFYDGASYFITEKNEEIFRVLVRRTGAKTPEGIFLSLPHTDLHIIDCDPAV